MTYTQKQIQDDYEAGRIDAKQYKHLMRADPRIPEGWTIELDPKPLPTTKYDWSFWHSEYDYCTELGGNGLCGLLCGLASSFEDALEQIIDIEAERYDK